MIVNYGEQQQYIRGLARRHLELCSTNENAEKRERWASHNELSGIQRPLLWICPDDDGAWREFIPDAELECADDDLRNLELILKKYWYQSSHFKDDFVFEPRIYLTYPGIYTGVLYGDDKQKSAWGVAIEKTKISDKAYHLNNFLKTDADFEALLSHEVDFVPDEAAKAALAEKAQTALDGILEVELQLPYSVLVQSHLIELVHLRGLEELMFDLYDNDELLMRVLRHMAQSKARLLKRLEEKRLLFDNRVNIYTGSGGLGYTHSEWKAPGDVTLADMWGFADAQEFSNVSPDMFLRFAVENQKIGLNLFGLACYGCCEPMDGKYDAVFRALPRLRRISVSPWANVNEAAEQIGSRAIFSWKPNPAEICRGFDEDKMLSHLKQIAGVTKNCHTEIILKDLRTCNGTNEPLVKFAALVEKAFW